MRHPLATLALATALLSACSDDPQPPDDVTPPEVRSRYPAHGEHAAFAGDGFRVTFSEPLDAASVTAEHVRVLQGADERPVALSLSADGTTLRILPAGLTFPGGASVLLGPGLRDRAGNGLAGESALWTFELPVWVDLGAAGPMSAADGPNPTPSVALDANGSVVAAMGEIGSVSWWAEGAWHDAGAPWLSIVGRITGAADGEIWLTDRDGPRRWSGAGGWGRVGPPVETGGGYPWDAFVVPGPEPLQVWSQCLPVAPGECDVSVQARALVGGSWVSRGEIGDPVLPWIHVAWNGTAVFLAGSTGSRVYVYELAEDGPRALPEPLPDGTVGGPPAIAVGADGRPVVTLSRVGGDLLVRRWTGTGWEAVGEALATFEQPRAAAVAVAATGHPVVAWTEADALVPLSPRRLRVARHTDEGWMVLPGPVNLDPEHDVWDVALALDAGDAPVVAWPEATGAQRVDSMGHPYDLYVGQAKRLNR